MSIDRFNDEVKREEYACARNSQVLVLNEVDQVKSRNNELFMKEDVQLAVTHDLLQHERMMECLRRLSDILSDCHEALSRSLDGFI